AIAAGQLALEVAAGLVQDFVQALAFWIGRALARLARHLHPGLACELVDRIEELEPVVVHQERGRRAVRAAAEAVVELLGRRDRERGRALVVERAARRILPALALERHARLDHLDDVGARQQFVDEGVGDARHQPGLRGTRARAPAAPAMAAPLARGEASAVRDTRP